MPGICIDTLNYRFSKAIKCPEYEESGLCEGIPLLLSKEAILADLGAVRAQEDWLKHIGPLVNHRGGMGPEISFIPAIIPECLPDRLEVMGYANEFGFMHDDHADAGDKQQVSVSNVLVQGAPREWILSLTEARAAKKIPSYLTLLMSGMEPQKRISLEKRESSPPSCCECCQ